MWDLDNKMPFKIEGTNNIKVSIDHFLLKLLDILRVNTEQITKEAFLVYNEATKESIAEMIEEVAFNPVSKIEVPNRKNAVDEIIIAALYCFAEEHENAATMCLISDDSDYAEICEEMVNSGNQIILVCSDRCSQKLREVVNRTINFETLIDDLPDAATPLPPPPLIEAGIEALLPKFTLAHDQVRRAVFSPITETLVSAGGERIKLWSLDTRQAQENGAAEGAIDVCFRADGEMLASCGSSTNVKVWACSEQGIRGIKNIPAHAYNVTSVSFCGQDIITSGSDEYLKSWTLEPVNERRLTGQVGPSVAMARVNVTGTLIAAAAARTLAVWSTTGSMELQRSMTGHTAVIRSLAWAPDCQRPILASGAADWAIIVWNTADGTRLAMSVGHWGGVNALCFAADGKALRSVSEDSTWRTWDWCSEVCQRTVRHDAPVKSIGVKEKLVATCSSDSIYIWEVHEYRHGLQHGTVRVTRLFALPECDLLTKLFFPPDFVSLKWLSFVDSN